MSDIMIVAQQLRVKSTSIYQPNLALLTQIEKVLFLIILYIQSLILIVHKQRNSNKFNGKVEFYYSKCNLRKQWADLDI